jgi:hypothetical protein
MASAGLGCIRLHPESRGWPTPNALRIFPIFNSAAGQHLIDDYGHLVQTFPPELTEPQQTVVGLLGVPASSYQ